MGGVGEFFTGSSPSVADPWVGDFKTGANDFLKSLQGLFSKGAPAGLFGANPLETAAAGEVGKMDPSSWLNDATGALGSTYGDATGLMDQAIGEMGPGGVGGTAKNTLMGYMDPKFLDVASDPTLMARNQGITNQIQKQLNANLDTVRGAGQRASGGTFAGSPQAANESRTVQQSMGNLSDTLSSLSAQDLNTRLGIQSNTAMNAPGMFTGILNSLAQGKAGLGQGYANTLAGVNKTASDETLGKNSFLSALGGGLQARAETGWKTPMDMLLQLFASAKGAVLPGSAGGFSNLMGGISKGAGAARDLMPSLG